MLCVMLFPTLNVLFLSEVCVQCPTFFFISSPPPLPLARGITGVTFVCTFHLHCISTVRSLYFWIFSASFLITFLSPEIVISINIHVPFSVSWIMLFRLLLGMVPFICTCWFLTMVTVPSRLACSNFGTCLYPCSLSNLTPYFLAYVKV